MKKLTLCLLSFLVPISLFSQDVAKSVLNEGGQAAYDGPRTIFCPPTSIYSHQVNYDNGLSSQEGHVFYWDRIEAAPVAPISQVVFFGIAMGTPHRDFTINFYQDDGGEPGTLKASYTSFITGETTGEFLFDMEAFSYTYTLPGNLIVNAGDWICIIAANVQGELWYWLTADGGDGCVWTNYLGAMCDMEDDLAFCLVGSLGAQAPLSPWALGLAVALIGLAVVLRYRRMM